MVPRNTEEILKKFAVQWRRNDVKIFFLSVKNSTVTGSEKMERDNRTWFALDNAERFKRGHSLINFQNVHFVLQWRAFEFHFLNLIIFSFLISAKI